MKTNNNMNRHQRIQINNYEIQTESVNGIDYIIVPAVMMLEGVHHGSHGAILHTAEGLSKEPTKWDGTPVTIYHPKKEGQYISANEEGVMHVGVVENTRWEDGKLKASLRLNANLLLAESVEASTYINEGSPVDVSVGVFSDALETAGVWNGEEYTAVAQTYTPDHLAILPGVAGACSWTDGCGIRVNENKSSNKSKSMKKLTINEMLEHTLIKTDLQVNEQGMIQRLEKVRDKVYAMDSAAASYYVEEVYEGEVVYRKSEKVGETSWKTSHYKQPYSVNETGDIEWTADPTRVRKEVEYINVNSTQENITNKKKGESKMNVNKKEPCCINKVEELIANVQTRFTASDLDWLKEMSEEQIAKLQPTEIKVNVEVSPEKVTEHLNTYEKVEDVVALMPEAMQTAMKEGIAMYEKNRKETIQSIMANTGETWTEVELNAMNNGMLEKIAKSMKTTADFSGRGGQEMQHNSDEEFELLLPPGVEVENK